MSHSPSDSPPTPAAVASSADGNPAGPIKVEFADPHIPVADLQEAEVTRIRTLQGGWRWALIVTTAATILLCVNQQFSLRFFIDYTQLNTEYFYLLIALMLPFTFLIFPGTATAPLDRIPWYDILLFALTFAAAIWLMLNIRKAAQFGWEFEGARKKRHRSRPRDVVRADGGAAAHRRLEPVAQRIAVHALSAVCRRQMARSLPRHAVHPAANHCLSHAVRREPARYSDSGLRRYGDRLSG